MSEEASPIVFTVMNQCMEALFESLLVNEDYKEALDFVSDCFGFVPTPLVINQIIFKIMIKGDEELASKAEDYMESMLRIMSRDDEKKCIIMEGLNYESRYKVDVWKTFSHFVLSCLYHLKISEDYLEKEEYVKYPNCEFLVNIYVKAFVNCRIKRDILGSHADKRLVSLLQWINLFYKYNIQRVSVVGNLHHLLDYIIDCEISNDPHLPSCVKIHSVNLSDYMFLILNFCKDVFATIENQQRFFNKSNSCYLITKVCQYRLHELIEEEVSTQNPGMLTLKSIVENYFFQKPKKSKEQELKDSCRKSNRLMNLKPFSKDPIPGDIDLHEFCRHERPADLLASVYKDKTKDINLKNSCGRTPLHEACVSGSYLCCKFLIEEAGEERKADFRATDNEGWTPLHYAVYVNATDVVNLLLSKGGNSLVEIPDNYGMKPVEYSTRNEMREKLQEIESQLKIDGGDKLPNLKNSADYHLYLRTLKTLIANYLEIYDIPKVETDVKILSHDSEECYHYKAENKTLCMEDSTMLETFGKVVKKFITSAELIAKTENVKKELKRWNTLLAAFS